MLFSIQFGNKDVFCISCEINQIYMWSAEYLVDDETGLPTVGRGAVWDKIVDNGLFSACERRRASVGEDVVFVKRGGFFGSFSFSIFLDSFSFFGVGFVVVVVVVDAEVS